MMCITAHLEYAVIKFTKEHLRLQVYRQRILPLLEEKSAIAVDKGVIFPQSP